VEIRSLDELNLPLAWRRILFRMRRFIDVPDRLPFEVLDRLYGGDPELSRDHHLRPVTTVMATKGSGTVRPFVRVSPIDLLLYQALVDRIATDIEASLSSRQVLFSYRVDTSGSEDFFEGSPKWDDFMEAVRSELANDAYTHALTGDIASYFVYVDVDELERRLLASCSASDAVRDLSDLLRSWHQLGIRGLPQGMPPSSVLGNFYLSGLDVKLQTLGFNHKRYMDDFWIFTSSYEDARRAQDAVERLLYSDGLGLGGEKSRIRRTSTALAATEPAQARIQRRREELVDEVLGQSVGEYVDVEDVELPEAEIDTAAVHGEFDEIVLELGEDRYPVDVRARLTEVFRSLEKGRDSYAVDQVPHLLIRLPDLMWPAIRYVASVRVEDAPAAEAALLQLLDPSRFHREQEWLHLCRGGLWFRRHPSTALGARFAEVALQHEHQLVRARALLAWGRLSKTDDFATADAFWRTAERAWQAYVLIALQHKDTSARDERYANWSGEGRFLRMLASAIQERPFAWRDL